MADAPDAKACWAAMSATAIPSKTYLHSSFVRALDVSSSEGLRVLDLGCGDGRIALGLLKDSHEVVGVDCNEEAIRTARAQAAHCQESDKGRVSFHVGDVCEVDLADPPFDVVLVQLVISVVGGLSQRQALLANARRHMKSNGTLLLSASGASEEVNDKYRQTYEEDMAITGEWRSYLSRGPKGEVLYTTHHFEEKELELLLAEAGFTGIRVCQELEQSSRRPEEKAVFLYVTAEVP